MESAVGVEVGISIGKIHVVSIDFDFVAEEDVAEVFEGFSYSWKFLAGDGVVELRGAELATEERLACRLVRGHCLVDSRWGRCGGQRVWKNREKRALLPCQSLLLLR